MPLHTLLRGMKHAKTFALKEEHSEEELARTQALLVRHYTDEDDAFRAAAVVYVYLNPKPETLNPNPKPSTLNPLP